MIDSLLALATQDLRLLASGLKDGRVGAPFTALSLGQYVRSDSGAGVAVDLSTLHAGGLGALQIALLLETLCVDRERRGKAETQIDLVSTGPEAPGVTNRDTRVVVAQLFREANSSVIVAGFAVYQGLKVFEALAARMEDLPDLRVQMFLDVQRPYSDTSAPSEIVRRFSNRFTSQEWPGSRIPELYYDPRSLETEKAKRASLHAKCIVVDSRKTFISSANFTEAAQLRNIEVGVMIESQILAQQLENHLRALIQHDLVHRIPFS